MNHYGPPLYTYYLRLILGSAPAPSSQYHHIKGREEKGSLPGLSNRTPRFVIGLYISLTHDQIVSTYFVMSASSLIPEEI